MNTSQTTKWLNRPDKPERTPLDVEAYMRSKNQSVAHQMILAEFKKSGITQAELAKRTGKGADIISRLIGRPGNWTLNTLSDLLFAMSGVAPCYSITYPLLVTSRNQTKPAWAEKKLHEAPKLPGTTNLIRRPSETSTNPTIIWSREMESAAQ